LDFSVHERSSAAAIRRFNERASIPVSRVEAIASAGNTPITMGRCPVGG
jgi:hypothetical protein